MAFQYKLEALGSQFFLQCLRSSTSLPENSVLCLKFTVLHIPVLLRYLTDGSQLTDWT